MDAQQKGRPGWHRKTASQQNKLKPYCSDSLPKIQGHRLPAYGRSLVAAQRSGRNVSWVVLSLDWDYGRIFPRLVIPVDMRVDELDLRLVRGLECLVAHRGEPTRALDIAELALANGAKICPVIDVPTGRTTYTAEIIAARGVKVAA